MDIGFTGNFTCLKKSVNEKIHSDWIAKEKDKWVELAPTEFQTVFANDIRPDAKAHGYRILEKKTRTLIQFISLQVL